MAQTDRWLDAVLDNYREHLAGHLPGYMPGGRSEMIASAVETLENATRYLGQLKEQYADRNEYWDVPEQKAFVMRLGAGLVEATTAALILQYCAVNAMLELDRGATVN
jgi:hypothetical protein